VYVPTMLLASQVSPYFIAVLISVTPPNLPPKGWVQMLQPFDTIEECKAEIASEEYNYFISVVRLFQHIIKKVEVMKCMTQEDIKRANEQLGHSNSKKPETIGI